MRKEEGKAHLNALRRVVMEVLRDADPGGLFEMGAPADEYAPEVGTILPRLGRAASAEEVRAILHQEFVRGFDAQRAGTPETYDRAAQQISAFLSTWGAG